MNRQVIDDITKIASAGSADQVRALRSPVDGSALIISFHGGAKPALSIISTKGEFRLNLDGVAQEPPWVREVGSKIETRVQG